MLTKVILSLNIMRAIIGVNNGIVEIITAPVVAETWFIPLLSNMKYRNGSKNANKKNILRSLDCIF